jgi:hypothetical protein
MLRLATDADVNEDIVSGLFLQFPELDLLRSRDVLGENAPDPDVLQWAGSDGRVLVTNDRRTMHKHVWERKAEGKLVPGVVFTTLTQPVGAAIDDILLLALCMPEEEIAARVVVYLPFRG